MLVVFVPNEVQIWENKRFTDIETHGDNVFSIFTCHFHRLFDSQIFPERFLVIC